MVRPPRNDKPAIKKGAWSSDEDKKLMAYISKYGIWNWSQMPKFAGLSRSGKSCRLRWMNYLRPDVKLGNFTEEEDDIIMNMHEKLGSRWSAIAKQLPGRTDNEIKNHWHSRLKKRLLVNNTDSVNPSSKRKADEMSITCEDAILENSHGSNAATDPPNGSSQNSALEGLCHVQNSPNLAVCVASSNGEGDFGVDIGSSTRLNTSSSEMIEDYDEIFWSEPIFMENLSLEEQQHGYLQSQFDPILWSPGPINPTSSFINDIYNDNDSILYSVLEKEDMFYVGEHIFQF